MRKRFISIVALILVLMSLPVVTPADTYIHPAQRGDQGGALAAEFERGLQQQENSAYAGLGYTSAMDTSGRDPRFLTPEEVGNQSTGQISGATGTPSSTAADNGYVPDPRFVTPGSSTDNSTVVDPRFVTPGSVTGASDSESVVNSGAVTNGAGTGYAVDPRFVIPGTNNTPVVNAADGTVVPSTAATSSGVQTLDWFSGGADLLKNNKSITIYDTKTGTTWGATYINGANHADVIPASKSDASLIKEKKITGSYERRPVVVTIAGTKYAGSMYAVGHGSTSYCSYFKGVMCIHFTGSKTHGSKKVDSAHQSAIAEALSGGN